MAVAFSVYTMKFCQKKQGGLEPMLKQRNKILSLVLCLAMLISVLPLNVFASPELEEGMFYFDFAAAEYFTDEDAGELNVVVKRHGGNAEEVNVYFKAADFLSAYGIDYEILDEDGNPLSKIDGVKPQTNELIFEEEDSSVVVPKDVTTEESIETEAETEVEVDVAGKTTEAEEEPVEEIPDEHKDNETEEERAYREALEELEEAEEAGVPLEEDIIKIINEESAKETEENGGILDAIVDFFTIDAGAAEIEETTESETVTDDENADTAEVAEVEEGIVNTEKKATSRGSNLLDAQAAYLNLPEDTKAEEAEEVVSTALSEFYSYMQDAEGAEGILHFDKGETEKTITIVINDNDTAESAKIFMMALIATDNPNGTIAANASTYVTINDDEEYVSPIVSLVETSVEATPEKQTAYITVERSGNIDYFTTAYVSTVSGSANETDYTDFNNVAVAFVPGETQKQIMVNVNDFSEEASFGVRLEGGDDVIIDNHYTKVNILPASQPTEEQEPEMALMDAEMSLMAISGPATWKTRPDQLKWKKYITGDGNITEQSDGSYRLRQYDKSKSTAIITQNKENLVGVKRIDFDIKVKNTSGSWPKKNYNDYRTYMETDSDQNISGSVDGTYVHGKAEKVCSLTLNKTGDSAYIHFETRPHSGGYDNPDAYLNYLTFNYCKYAMAAQGAKQTFTRVIYDYTNMNGNKPGEYDTYYEGQQSKSYDPGGITIKSGNSTIDAFYRNSNTHTITAKNAVQNEEYGIRLKGVYFTSSEKNSYEGTSDRYWLEAKNGSVVFLPNTEFIQALKKAKVINNVHIDASLKVWPVYEQATTTVEFYSTSESYTSDNYDQASHLANVHQHATMETNKTYNVFGAKRNRAYATFPVGSILRLQIQTAGEDAAEGVVYQNGNSAPVVSYYKVGDKIASGSDYNGTIVNEENKRMADVPIGYETVKIMPNVAAQTFRVEYSPQSRDALFNTMIQDSGGNWVPFVTSLENTVLDMTDATGTAEGLENVPGTDKQGSMWINNPVVGKNYSLQAFAPTGYFVTWANMTGDANGDGQIDDKAGEYVPNTNNPIYVHGSKIKVGLDQDYTRYYYAFMPKSSDVVVRKTGTILRENNTLWNLSKGIASNKTQPVVGSYVDVAGFTAMTDTDGKYEVMLSGLPDWGNVSFSFTDSGKEYITSTRLEVNNSYVLPALTNFTAKSVSATYAENQNMIAGNLITVVKDTLTLSATVEAQTAITAKDVKFYIYDKNGNERRYCNTNENYVVEASPSRNSFTATLTFNPKADIEAGDKVYMSIVDMNDNEYPPIDMGFNFFAELTLDNFIFPALGNKTIEETVTQPGIVVDIIGDPLSNMSINSISGFNTRNNAYTPVGLPPEDELDYTWLKTDYTWGWSDSFGSKISLKNNEAASKTDETLKATEGVGKANKGSSLKSGNFTWGLAPEVGFKLTLSSRNDPNDPNEQKVYFEDLVFYVKLGYNVGGEGKVMLPIGIAVVIGADLTGDMSGIYHMYVDYNDSYETEDAVPYTSDDFGVFKSFGEKSSVRREGYIFLNPKVDTKLGLNFHVVTVYGTAAFDFNMDFRFTEENTSVWGDVTIDLGWGIELVGFNVYKKDYRVEEDLKMYSYNTDGPIDFSTEGIVNSASLMALNTVNEYMGASDDEKLITNKTIDRSYLANRSEWLGSGGMSLFDIGVSEGTEENVLQTGVSDNPYMSITKINDSEMLMVYVDDAPNREDIHKRAVYYSIGDGSNWSNPEIIDNDGTLDDFPYVYDMGDKILVAWSSAGDLYGGDPTVTDVLSSLDIKATFFNKATKEFGSVAQLTKKTSEDYTADIMPRAAYDNETGKLILYYTKTEYKELGNTNDLYDEDKNPSVTAYLFYDFNKEAWLNNADDDDVYTDEELAAFKASFEEETREDNPDMSEEAVSTKADEMVNNYIENWYGQRFLDLRINGTDSDMLRIVDSDSISYNGLSIYAWTVDWHRDLNTTDDRDVFIQIYNFEEDSFTHNIRVTTDTNEYAAPKLVRSDNATYLFFGGKSSTDSTHGAIYYVDITDAIKNEQYTKTTSGDNEYYVLQYEEDGETRYVVPSEAVQCDNIMDYDVFVDNNGVTYLFWTESNGSSRVVKSSMFNKGDFETEDTGEGIGEDEEAPKTAYTDIGYWSEPLIITDETEENVYYIGLGASAIDGKVYIGAAKGNYEDESDTALVLLEHTPYSDVQVTAISLEDSLPKPGQNIQVNVTVKNNGMLPAYNAVKVTLEINGTPVEEKEINGVEVYSEEQGTTNEYAAIAGASEYDVIFNATIPEDAENVTFKAYVDSEKAVEYTLETKARIEVADGEIKLMTDNMGNTYNEYTTTVTNTGNDDAENLVINAYSAGEAAGSHTLEALAAGESSKITMAIEVPDSHFTLANNVFTAPISVEASLDEDVVYSSNETAYANFSEEAYTLIPQVTDITFEDKYEVNANESISIQPTISGVAEGSLEIAWQTSSDNEVAFIDGSNAIYGTKDGTVTITGYLVPVTNNIYFDSYGNEIKTDWTKLIPEDMLRTVTATVVVKGKSSDNNNYGGGGGGTTKYTVNLETNGGNELAALKITRNTIIGYIETPVREGYVFDGWYTDEALTVKADLSAKVTSNMTLYAKWIEGANQDADSDGWVNPFEDVKAADWFYENVKYAHQNGLFNGTTETTFSPNEDLTRAMLVTVLYRSEGQPEVEIDSKFVDVEDNAYYADAVAWAEANGIVLGISDTEFAPDVKISREQIAAIMYRYAIYKGLEAVDMKENLTFTDADDISEYAVSAMNWIVGQEIIKGYEDGTVRPQNNATRAEAAAVLQRFLEKLNAMENIEE